MLSLLFAVIETLLIVVGALHLIYEYKTGVPTFSSIPSARKHVVTILRDKIIPRMHGDKCSIIDLGSGNGLLCAQIAQAIPQSTVTGIEISPVPYLVSQIRRLLLGPKNTTFYRQDFWPYKIDDVDIVVAFLNGNVLDRFSQKLRSELKEGAYVITVDTPMWGDWQPVDVVPTGFFSSKIYVYQQRLETQNV